MELKPCWVSAYSCTRKMIFSIKVVAYVRINPAVLGSMEPGRQRTNDVADAETRDDNVVIRKVRGFAGLQM